MSNIPLRPEIGELGYTSLSSPTCLVQVVSRGFGGCASGDSWATFPSNFRQKKKENKHLMRILTTLRPKKTHWSPLDRKASEGWETPTPTILVDSFPLRLLCSNLQGQWREEVSRQGRCVFFFTRLFHWSEACLLAMSVTVIFVGVPRYMILHQPSRHTSIVLGHLSTGAATSV